MDLALPPNLNSTVIDAQAKKQAAMQSAGTNQQKIKAAGDEFEAVYLSQMMDLMFSKIETDPMFGGGKGEEVFRSMMMVEYGRNMVKAGGVGLSASIQQQLLKYQEAQSDVSPIQ